MKIINIIMVIIAVLVSVACTDEVVVYEQHVSGLDISYAKDSVTAYFGSLGVGETIESMEYVPYMEDNIVYKNELDISNNTPNNVIVISVDVINSPQTSQMVTLIRNNSLSGPNKWEVINVSQGAANNN